MLTKISSNLFWDFAVFRFNQHPDIERRKKCLPEFRSVRLRLCRWCQEFQKRCSHQWIGELYISFWAPRSRVADKYCHCSCKLPRSPGNGAPSWLFSDSVEKKRHSWNIKDQKTSRYLVNISDKDEFFQTILLVSSSLADYIELGSRNGGQWWSNVVEKIDIKLTEKCK